jgi:hypothetical protein
MLSAIPHERAQATGGGIPCLCVEGRVDTLVPAAPTAAGAALLAAFGTGTALAA